MADTFERESDLTDPYKATTIIVAAGKASYGIWRPLDVQIDGDEELYPVDEAIAGTLEFIADEVYKNRALWPVIAHANKIDFPLRDVKAGMRLIIPKESYVRAALQERARQLAVSEGQGL